MASVERDEGDILVIVAHHGVMVLCGEARELVTSDTYLVPLESFGSRNFTNLPSTRPVVQSYVIF